MCRLSMGGLLLQLLVAARQVLRVCCVKATGDQSCAAYPVIVPSGLDLLSCHVHQQGQRWC